MLTKRYFLLFLVVLVIVFVVIVQLQQIKVIQPNTTTDTSIDELRKALSQLEVYNKNLEEELETAQKEVEDLHKQQTQLKDKLEQQEHPSTCPPPSTLPPTIVTNDDPKLNALLQQYSKHETVATNYDNFVFLTENFNKFGKIRNTDKFKLAEDYIPIVIRVFNKDEYFGFALENYRTVRNINQTLMIVSHDGIFPEMFKLVQQIDFMQVKQILHPFSGHSMQNRFPGPDTTLKYEGEGYGNRAFPATALKHHYWWHLNYIWDSVLRGFDKNIIMMEEDHIPTIDFYDVAISAAKLRDEKCPDCFNAKIHQHSSPGGAFETTFISWDLGNVGVIIDRPRWNILKSVGKEFCNFNDYNWDWTLTYLVGRDLISGKSLTVAMPRAEHYGKCGTHEKSDDCAINDGDRNHFKTVNAQITAAREKVGWDNFQLRLDSTSPQGIKPSGHGGWGGWIHEWDHKHCIDLMSRYSDDSAASVLLPNFP